MGQRQNKYRKVGKLPDNAMSVAQYAIERGCRTSNVYKCWRLRKGRNKNGNFEIVEYQGLNFVLPQ